MVFLSKTFSFLFKIIKKYDNLQNIDKLNVKVYI